MAYDQKPITGPLERGRVRPFIVGDKWVIGMRTFATAEKPKFSNRYLSRTNPDVTYAESSKN